MNHPEQGFEQRCVAEARRQVSLNELEQDYIDATVSAITFCGLALVGIPGEPFTDIGVQIKDTEGWKAIMPCCLTNGTQGYFPMQSAFDEGGYEARGSNYKPGVAEAIIAGAKKLLKEMKGE